MSPHVLPKILLFGAGGQLGKELFLHLDKLFDVTTVDYRLLQEGGNLCEPEYMEAIINRIEPNVIINAAGYTKVDMAESNESIAYMVNSSGVKSLGICAKKIDALLVHFSSDYVYDGLSKRPYLETDQANPLNVYGKSKLGGDRAIIDSGCKHLIFRTSWIYSEHGDNFLKSILSAAQSQKSMAIVNDQFGVPTSAALLARVTRDCLKHVITMGNLCGIYNVVPSGRTSWYEYAAFAINKARCLGAPIKVSNQSLLSVRSEDFHIKAQRPKNSVLDTTKFRETFDLELPHWKSGVANVVEKMF